MFDTRNNTTSEPDPPGLNTTGWIAGVDLIQTLHPANSWVTHLNDPTSYAASTSNEHLKDIIHHGTHEYERLVKYANDLKARADYLQGMNESRDYASSSPPRVTAQEGSLPTQVSGRYTIHSAEQVRLLGWFPPVSTYSDWWFQDGKSACQRSKCGYVHEDQKIPYADIIAGLKFANSAQEWKWRAKHDNRTEW